MELVFGQFAATASGLSALGLNVQAFVIQLLTFVIAFLVLRKWAFKPILKVLKERRDVIEQGVKLGEKMQKEQALMEEKMLKSLNAARDQADKIIAAAQTQAKDALSASVETTQVKVDSMLAEAKDRIAQDAALARKQIEKELVGLISSATEVIIHEKLSPQKDSALINQALKEQKI